MKNKLKIHLSKILNKEINEAVPMIISRERDYVIYKASCKEQKLFILIHYNYDDFDKFVALNNFLYGKDIAVIKINRVIKQGVALLEKIPNKPLSGLTTEKNSKKNITKAYGMLIDNLMKLRQIPINELKMVGKIKKMDYGYYFAHLENFRKYFLELVFNIKVSDYRNLSKELSDIANKLSSWGHENCILVKNIGAKHVYFDKKTVKFLVDSELIEGNLYYNLSELVNDVDVDLSSELKEEMLDLYHGKINISDNSSQQELYRLTSCYVIMEKLVLCGYKGLCLGETVYLDKVKPLLLNLKYNLSLLKEYSSLKKVVDMIAKETS